VAGDRAASGFSTIGRERMVFLAGAGKKLQIDDTNRLKTD
jgi:hypothetical protein